MNSTKYNTMKKFIVAFVFAATLGACHYGNNEAQQTLEANEQYKSEKADYSVNRANVQAAAGSEDTATAMPVDTAATTK